MEVKNGKQNWISQHARCDAEVLTASAIVIPPQPDIVLVAINARYSHCSLATRSLLANMRDAQPRMLEFEIKQSPSDVAAQICASQPAIVAIGVYIWNRSIVERILPLLRSELPQAKVILGGPEISYDLESCLAQQADCVICGESESVLPQICNAFLLGDPVNHIHHPPLPDLSTLNLPIHEYSDKDLAHRNIYIETSRGCPCACRFCLSSLTCGVRYYPLPKVFDCLDHLLARGARRFRFVDRSFNLAGERSVQILAFFVQKKIPDLFLHLEIVPEFLSAQLRETILQFEPHTLHIETGIQSLSPAVLKRIHRPAHPDKALEGIAWLSQTARATVHADLIAGLPGETLEMLQKGFNALCKTGPAEIQLGILKHLPGTDLHLEPGMRFSKNPPYEVLESDAMSPADIDSVQRFASHWERVINRDHFPETATLLLQGDDIWQSFDTFSQSLELEHGRHGIGFVEIARRLYHFLPLQKKYSSETIRTALEHDYLAGGRRINLPAFLRPPKAPFVA
jgi:hypothetical protein